MLTIDKYQITQNFISGLPQDPFRKGVGHYEGVCMHSTAVYNDIPIDERQFESTHWKDAFVHGFVGQNDILQIADTKYLSYGCCHMGNQFLLNLELCQSHDHNIFLAAYDRWVWTAAYWLYARKLGVVDKVTLWSHKEVSDQFHESNHQDPIAYLAEHGKHWNDVVNDVTNYYNTFVGEDKMIQELQAQVVQLQVEVQKLKDDHAMPSIPEWAKEAVQSAVSKGVLANPEGRSSDFYALVAVLRRLKLL